jgi:hypothetical protein
MGIPQMLDDLAAQLLPYGIRVPVSAAQHILEAIGSRRAADFRHLPAVLALGLTEQALQIRLHPVAGLRARKIGGQPPCHVRQLGLAARHDAGRRIRRSQQCSLRCVIHLLHGSVLPP